MQALVNCAPSLKMPRKRVRSLQQRTILFLDEIHRFNKSQQDVLLPCVEDGTIFLLVPPQKIRF